MAFVLRKHTGKTLNTHTVGGGRGGGQRFKVILTTHKFEASLDYETLEGKGEWGRGVRAFSPIYFCGFGFTCVCVYLCIFAQVSVEAEGKPRVPFLSSHHSF